MRAAFKNKFRRKKTSNQIESSTQNGALTTTGSSPTTDPSGNSHDSIRDSIPATKTYGIETLYSPSDPELDICFVHGLNGGSRSTWTAAGHADPWPATILSRSLSDSGIQARIMTYGYDADVVRLSVASTNGLKEHANTFLNTLSTERRSPHSARSRPIVLVAHSLGGLVCKEAVLLSRDAADAHLTTLFDSLRGIVFLGTPHRGSWMARWASIPASALSTVKSTNTSLLGVLRTDNEYLGSVQERFWTLVRKEERLSGRSRRLEVLCCYEELPILGAGLVVPRESATVEGYNSVAIRADHRDMCRFKGPEETGFKMLLAMIERVMEDTEEERAAEGQTWSARSDGRRENTTSRTQMYGNFLNYGTGEQFNAQGGTINRSSGSGNQFPGANISGNVYIGQGH